MKNKIKTAAAILIAVFIITFIIPHGPVYAAQSEAFSNNVTETLNEIEADLCKENKASGMQKLLDGAFSDNPSGGAEWYAIALRSRHNDLYYGNYRKALEQLLKDSDIKSETTRLRLALALRSLESDMEYDPLPSGFSDTSGIMSYIFGLHLINNDCKGPLSADDLVHIILDMQHADGGWSVIGSDGDPDVSAMVIQALAPYKNNDNVKKSLDDAIAFLSEAQMEDGGYYSMGAVNCESSCQVLMALCSMDIDAADDDRFIKNGNTVFDAINSFKAMPGKYSHISGDGGNTSCTTQVYLAFSCYDSFLNGNDHFYVFDSLVEAEAPKYVPVKIWLYAAIAMALAVYCAAAFIKGKRKIKTFVFPICVSIIAAAAVTFINVQSAQSYYKEGSSGGDIETYITINACSVAGKNDFIPTDGMILESEPVNISDGDTAKDQLILAAKANQLQLEFDGTGYVCGLNNIYEFDFGDLSGWVFRVNGETPGRGSYDVKLEKGDTVEWIYSLELGKDID